MANQHGLGTIQNTLNISRGNLQATAAGGTNGKTKGTLPTVSEYAGAFVPKLFL